MAIKIIRNEQANCITFRGTSVPAYFNACLSGVVSPDDPDGRCKELADKAGVIGLDDHFIKGVSDNPAYADIPFPPLHPNCKCTVVEVLEDEI